MNILLTVAYDGTNYSGWQRQDNVITVQERLEDAVSALLERSVAVRASSRTDAGVHALGQRVCFSAPDLKVPVGKLPVVLGGFLPWDISVVRAEVVSDEFNPQFNAKCKTYVYNIFSGDSPNPLVRRYSAFAPGRLDINCMKKAAGYFIGRHDFAAFCAAGGSAKTTVREVYDCFAEFGMEGQPSGCFSISITGSGFLYNMVRIIAGTVLYAGIGKIRPEDIPGIIASKDRTKAGKTMPPQGLVLMEVKY